MFFIQVVLNVPFIYAGLFIYRDDVNINTWHFSSVYINAEEPAVYSRFAPKDSADKRLQICSSL